MRIQAICPKCTATCGVVKTLLARHDRRGMLSHYTGKTRGRCDASHTDANEGIALWVGRERVTAQDILDQTPQRIAALQSEHALMLSHLRTQASIAEATLKALKKIK